MHGGVFEAVFISVSYVSGSSILSERDAKIECSIIANIIKSKKWIKYIYIVR